jgi:DNA-binding IclR family transcriptional regulator
MAAGNLRALYHGHVFGDRGDAVPSSLAALEAQLADDRTAPCLVSGGYYESGLAVVAAPVREAGGRMVAAINATCAGSDARHAQALCPVVIEAADTLSSLLGAQPAAHTLNNGERAWA